NNGRVTDDLLENPLAVVDGGDGTISGSDYILFYANGPDEWIKDSLNQGFLHRKNIYSDKSYYFLSIGGTGKRISNAPLLSSPVTAANSFSERYFHELDTVSFLASGKEWYGEEMSNLPGRSLTRNFNVSFLNPQSNALLQVRTACVARSVGAGSGFDIRINNQPALQLPINPVGSGQYDLFGRQVVSSLAGVPGVQTNNSISFTYTGGSNNSQGWLNWFELFTRRMLSMNGANQLLFRDWSTVNNSRVEFQVSNAGNTTEVWDITEPVNPKRMQGSLVNNEFRFVNDATRLREYIAFNPTGFLIPSAEGVVANQDLHNSTAADLLIITHPSLLSQAQRLADIHRQQSSMRVVSVTTDQVYNEFGSGSPDPVAIRDLVKMYWDKYGLTANRPRYLLLFGDASFDYKNRIANNTQLVPAWQNNFSLDPLATYATDDFFGFLDDNEDINSTTVTNLLDIGIGRIPAKNIGEAKDFVDKLAAYYSPQALGPWRNNITFIADDEDNNLHVQDAEIITSTARAANPVFDQQKIYLDAFRQESGPGGSQYPQVNQASNSQLYNGTLIWNYNGHGGPKRLAEETILDQDMVNHLNNPYRLPLFITASCDFAPYDNPTVNSLGENILLRPKTGAIALMTTTRLVFAFSNRIMNNNYMQFALQPDASGKYKALGDAVKEAKNYTYQTSGDIPNNRKFTLLGDPALTLAFPALKVRATKVNGFPITQVDTLSATELTTIEGEITDWQGNLLNNFNGNVYSTVFDKPQTITTLANDPGSQVTTFQAQTNILFKGRTTASNGKFSFTFKVPKDINYQLGNGKLSLYAENAVTDGNGYFTNFLVGGAGTDNSGDKEGPSIKPFLNDELFVNGGVTNEAPVLIVKLADSSGINTMGTGIGHDIVATLDNDNRQYFILNDFYTSDLNSYQRGTVRFQLPEMEPGVHTLKIKAWDVLNNSNEAVLEFMVAKDEELELSHVLNYPNPFTNNTHFWFEHNKPGQPLQVQLHIMTITGRVVKTITQTVLTEGNRSAAINWDGRDDYGDKLGRGVYIYKIRVTAPDRKQKEILEKLVIL
ncbi:MAG TPA: type IX secretion system sortase PorU, partial [Chitinophagaceae bacterium]|nr:type IX secretion system sortase PorU [Chitinophagaceae bacterium]